MGVASKDRQLPGGRPPCWRPAGACSCQSEKQEAPVQGAVRRSALGSREPLHEQVDIGSQSCPCLAESTPCAGQQTGLSPPLFLLTLFWGPSCGVTGRERVQTLTLCCWSPGWVWLGSEDQGWDEAPGPLWGRKPTPQGSETAGVLAPLLPGEEPTAPSPQGKKMLRSLMTPAPGPRRSRREGPSWTGWASRVVRRGRPSS